MYKAISHSLVAAIAATINFWCAAQTLSNEQERACAQYGQLASAFVTDKQSGISFSNIERQINRTSATEAIKALYLDLANAIYNKPGSNALSADGAKTMFQIECISNFKNTAAGGKTIRQKKEISAYLQEFKTFNGKQLVALLEEYGIKILSLQTIPPSIEAGKNQPTILNFEFAGRASRKMPCRLSTWFNVPHRGPAEIGRSSVAFPSLDPDLDDPVLYWAATGRCSEAYSW